MVTDIWVSKQMCDDKVNNSLFVGRRLYRYALAAQVAITSRQGTGDVKNQLIVNISGEFV